MSVTRFRRFSPVDVTVRFSVRTYVRTTVHPRYKQKSNVTTLFNPFACKLVYKRSSICTVFGHIIYLAMIYDLFAHTRSFEHAFFCGRKLHGHLIRGQF